MKQITRYIDAMPPGEFNVSLTQSARIILLRLHAKKLSWLNCRDSLILAVKIVIPPIKLIDSLIFFDLQRSFHLTFFFK